MTYFLAFVQLFCIGAVTYYEYKKKSPIVFCWATLLLMFGIMHVVSSFIPDYTYSSSVLDTASVFVIIFCIIYLVTRVVFRSLMRRFIKPKENVELKSDSVLTAIKLVLFFSVALYGFFVIRTSGSLAAVNKDNVYVTMSSGSGFFLLSSYLYYSTAPIVLYYIKKKDWSNVIYVSLMIALRSMLSQSRMDMIIIFVGFIAVIIMKQKKQDFKTILVLGISAFVIIYAVYALRTFRYYYAFSDFSLSKFHEFNEKLMEFIKTDNGELGLRQVFYYFIDNNNQFSGFGTGDGYIRVMMLPIPSRFTFGLKPADMCITMGKAWKPDFKGIINYTVTPTLFGDCYANLGMFGVLLGAFWSLVATIMDAICNRRHEIFSLLFWGMIATVFVDIGRGSIYNPLCLIFYGSIFIIMYKTIARIKIGIRFGSLRQSRRLKI